MRFHSRVGIAFLFPCALLLAPTLPAQQSCPPPPVPTSRGVNIFNAEQEMFLGEAEAEHLQRQFKVIDDPDLTAYLQKIGDRLVQRMPPSSMKFTFVLYDLPVANAFGIAGGRIYVSRKLVGYIKSEDELAGLIGHELGHMAGHHAAIDFSTYLREMLGVSSVTDRKDIFDKYNQFLENFAKKPSVIRNAQKNEEPDQIVADRLGLYLSSTSGYDPQALVKFWDRFADTKGKTGGGLSDFFGVTKPDEKRLRDLQNELPSIPGPCGAPRPASTPGDFAAWQSSVLNYTGLGHRESLHNVLLRRPLDPPLRGDTNHLRFSPDGKYILAQDDSSIYILTREPFQSLFRIDALDAYPASFSMDSTTISFYTKGLRIETWNIADQERTALQELVAKNRCLQTELSSDGKYLACVIYADNFIGLRLYNTATGEILFEKKTFNQLTMMNGLFQLLEIEFLPNFTPHFVTMRFSPDSHYFVAAFRDEAFEALDTTSLKSIPLPGSIKKLLGRDFEFLGPDKIAGINGSNLEKSATVGFPDGRLIDEFSVGPAAIQPATRGNYILIRPIKDYAVGVMDMSTKKIFLADKEPGFDVFDDVAVVQRRNGEIALRQIPHGQQVASITLPRGPLAPLRATALSPDLKLLAVSERTRGGVWDLDKNERVIYVRGFSGAYFGPDGALYADFPKFEQTDRAVAHVNLQTSAADSVYKIEENSTSQYGAFLLTTKPSKQGGSRRENVALEVRDSVSGKSLWTRSFPLEAPGTIIDPENGTIALIWSMAARAAKAELAANQDLAKRSEGVKKEETNLLIEIVDAHSGKYQGGVIVDTNKGSFEARVAFAAGNSVLIGDSQNRILVYSLATGEQTGKGFGHAAEVSAASGLVAVENEAGQILLCDLATMEKRDEFRFSSSVSMKQFSNDGKRLFVLTASQVAYVIDLTGSTKSTAAGAPTAH
jgi:WD40 repeat protein